MGLTFILDIPYGKRYNVRPVYSCSAASLVHGYISILLYCTDPYDGAIHLVALFMQLWSFYVHSTSSFLTSSHYRDSGTVCTQCVSVEQVNLQLLDCDWIASSRSANRLAM